MIHIDIKRKEKKPKKVSTLKTLVSDPDIFKYELEVDGDEIIIKIKKKEIDIYDEQNG